LARANENIAAARDDEDDDDGGTTVPTDGTQEVVGDKGFHEASTIKRLADAGVRAYIPEREQRGERRWAKNGGREAATAVYRNRARLKSRKNKRLRRRRGELLERTFAHLGETGGHRRTRLRGRENAQKRYLMQAAAFNLGLVMRKLLGHGTPRALAGAAERLFAPLASALVILSGALRTIAGGAWDQRASHGRAGLGPWPARLTHSSTGR
jgi:transposase